MDDCGGGYSESIAEICDELQNGLTPLLIVTPNGRDESGANRDCYLFSPAARAPVHTNMFRFLGAPRAHAGRAVPRSLVCPVREGGGRATCLQSALLGTGTAVALGGDASLHLECL